LNKNGILLATTNHGKILEIKAHFANLPVTIYSLHNLNIGNNFLEKGKTFVENARGKSLFYSKKVESLTLAEDSGLEIECLNGAPGVFSARFAGPHATDEKNIQKVLGLMEGIPRSLRKARFVSYMVLSKKQRIITEVEGIVEGFIGLKIEGKLGFGYDPIFYYPSLRKTFAKLLPDEKNQVSHRGYALREMSKFLEKYLRRGENAPLLF